MPVQRQLMVEENVLGLAPEHVPVQRQRLLLNKNKSDNALTLFTNIIRGNCIAF